MEGWEGKVQKGGQKEGMGGRPLIPPPPPKEGSSAAMAETVFIMPMASDTKLTWFTVYFIAKNLTLRPLE